MTRKAIGKQSILWFPEGTWNLTANQLVMPLKWGIPSIGYRLDLADEKRIGKAKVANPVITPSEAFARLNTLIPCRENTFLLRER